MVGLGITMLLVACSTNILAKSIDNKFSTEEIAVKNYVNAVYTNNINAILSMLFNGKKHKIYYSLNKQIFRNYDKNDSNNMFTLQPQHILLHRIKRDLVEIKKTVNQNGGIKKITLDKMYASIGIMQYVKKIDSK